ncbi:MAG TPA: DNA polymerase I [Beijerinckiaceae bacterium]|jgi:DNA polymerase-1|nr:polA [Microvirga sp.]HZB38215.1 DNA polymerase I [Beijerinckiaceae bacterium]
MSAQSRPLRPGDQVFLVDGSSFVFRAYFQSMNQDRKYNVRPSDGLPTGALRLFCTKLYQFIREGAVGIKPTHLAIIFDKTEDTFRKEIYAEYKANRTEPPPELVPQFPLMREAVKAFGLVPIEEAGYEADDLIAAYSCKASEAGAQTLIVSADKDLMQLVYDGVTFYDFESGIPGKPGYRPERRLDRDGVIEKFGVPPEQVPDVQALVGDPTDNVPGVPGVGPKAAASLIAEMGSLEAILAYRDRPEDLDAVLQARLADLQREIDELAGQPVKIGSGGQIAEVLAQKFGISDLPLDKKGKPTVDAETLERLGCDHPFCRTLIRARNLSRVIGATTRKVLDNAEQAVVSKKLVTLDCNSPLAVPTEELALERLDPKRLVSFLKALELNQLVKRIGEAFEVEVAEVDPDPRLVPGGGFIHWDRGMQEAVAPAVATGAAKPAREGDPEAVAALATAPAAWSRSEAAPEMKPPALAAKRATEVAKIPFDTNAYRCITSLDELDRWVVRAKETGLIAFDTETNSLDANQAELVGLSLALAPGEAAYVPLAHRGEDNLFGGGVTPGQLAADDVLARLKPMLEDRSILKVGHNVKFDWLILKRHGIDVRPFDDTLLISYVLDAGRYGLAGHGMDELADRHLGHKTIHFKEVAGTGKQAVTFDRVAIDKATCYAAEDADATLRLWLLLKPRLAAERRTNVYESLERRLVDVIARMEMRGIKVDRQILSRLSGDFAQTLARIEAEIQEIAGEKFSPGSPKQLGDILFGKMGLPGARKTATGQWATGANVLEDLAAEGHALPKLILEWRQIAKLKSTYTDLLPGYMHPETKRVHTCYSLAATTTGRLSSSEPNLQNIPIRTEPGRKIRAAFVAEPGNKIISADYSQIELRILAHIADIPQLRQAFAEGIDIHAATASAVFGVPLKDMNPDLRRNAKTINFGIIYGISAFGLADRLGIDRAEAGAFIKQYFERFPGIRAYMEETKRMCRERGYVTTLFGRVCHYPDIAISNPSQRAAVERQAINAPIQGSASDIIRRAMIRMEDALAEKNLSARMLLQVHDELVFEAPEDEVEATLPVIRKVMEEAPLPAVKLSVPLGVDARAAGNWDEAH